MSDRLSRTGHRQRWLVLLTSIALLSTLLGVVLPPVKAAAAGTVLFENVFNNRTVDGTGSVTVPAPQSGSNVACLTARGNSATPPLLSCAGAVDAQGSGKLRLTGTTTNQIGAVFGASSFPTVNGLDVTFDTYQYGGGGADGMTFALAAVDPANPVAPTAIGSSGGSLGYSAYGGVSGLPNAYLGVGLDTYGNFSSSTYQGSGCTNQPNINAQVAGAVVVRGPGNARAGYCGLTTTYDGTTGSKVILRASTRAPSLVPVQVLVNPTPSSFTSSTGVSVAARSYKVVVTPVGQSTRTLTGTLPAASSTLYPSSTWTTSSGIPKQLAFGFIGSTGSITDVHEASNVKVLTFDAVPELAVATTSYVAATPAPGDPVNYVITPSVLTGADEANAVSVTQKTPTGVLPVGAYGTGWNCAAPVGQTITCTSTATSFASGTTLPTVNVVAIVTGSGVTSTSVQTTSSTTVSSTDGNTGTDTTTTAGTVPAAQTGIAVAPSAGSVAGGGAVAVSRTSGTTATAIEIGTTTEQQAGTPVVLLPCQGSATTGCFIASGTNLTIPAMPARSSAGSVTVTVVTLGTAGSATYLYADKPATIATPTATAGVTSAVLDWVAPANNGSAITGYTVTTYLNGASQGSAFVSGSATTRTLTGLTAGGSYTFTVAAVNAYGTSTPSAKSTAVVPYALPGAPTIGSVVAADLAVTLSWTAPSSNGSAITGYVVTPYIGATAQTAQTFASSATSQSITGLTAGTAYTFRVAAQNAAGTGPASASSAAATPNAQPTLAFAPPPAGFVGVAYSTQLAATGGTSPFVWSITSGTLPAGLTLGTSSGLLSGTPTLAGSYTFTIQVVDASNQSATKAVTLVVIGPPGAPAKPTATAGLQQVTLSWVAPSTNGAAITSYVITPYLSGTAQTPITVDAAATTRVLTGLTAGGSYTFTVAAVNNRGTSGASPASTAVVPYAALSAPTITAARAGNSSVALTWTAPSTDGGSPITGYVVTPYIGSVAQTPQTFAGTATSRIVTGLTAGTAYTFQVAARNASGATSIYRVNSGGPLVTSTDSGPNWSADNAATNPYHGTGSGRMGFSPSAGFDSTIPPGTPAALFDDERFDAGSKGDGGEMLWQFPVTSGATVKVRLYFANRYAPTGSVGQRVFDVNLDGVAVLSNFDIIAGAGADQTATMREFVVTSDGSVDIDFGHEIDNPLISAIEIIQTGLTTNGPASEASAAVTPNASPTLSFPAPPSAEVGVPYSTQLVVTGGTSPFVWSVTAGSLPAGLTLNATTGLLSGTPTTAGAASFTVQVTDAAGETATKAVSLVVAAAPTLTFSPAAGEVGVAYSQQPTVTGGTAPYTWKVGAGSLPAGVTLDVSTGLVSGTPTASGTFSVTVTVTDAFAVSASRTASIVIAALPTLTFTAPPAGQVAVAYSTTFTAAGGTTPLVWSVSAGSVPSGLTLNTSTGVLSGTPTTVATSSFTVTVTDAYNKAASKAVTLVVAAGPLVIVKTANVASTVAGSVVDFTITVTNTGTSAFTGVALTDPLGTPGSVLDDATYNANAATTSGMVSYAASAVSWYGNVPASGSVTITYSVTVSNPDTGNQVLTSTVTSSTSGTNCPSGSTDTRCTATVTVAGLSILKTANPSSTTPGSVVRFTIVVTNTGKTAYTGAALTDQLAGVLDDASYNADGAATVGQLSFTSPQLTWTGNLAVAASVTITYSVTVANPDGGDKSLVATVVSATAGSTCPSGSPAASCTTTVPVLLPGLAISNAADSSTTTPGAAVTYTQTVSNTGQTAYAGISVTLALGGALDDATYTSSSASSGTVAYNAGAGTVVWTGNLALGAAVTITETLSVSSPAVGDRSMTAVATSAAAGSTCPVGTSSAGCTATVQVLVPALTITQTTNVSTTTPGGVVRYTVTVTNTGQTPSTGATLSESLTGVLDDATYNADAAASSGTISFSVPTLSWTGNLAVAASATITYSVTARQPGAGDLSLVSTVVSNTPFNNCAASSTDSRCGSTVPVLIPGLTISTTVDPASTTTPGGVVRYSVVATNTGQTTYTGASISLNFAGVFDDATYNNDAATTSGSLVTNANGSIVWALSLAPGQSATGTTSFTVFDPTPASGADKILTSTVTSDAAGSTCPTGSTSAACRTSIAVLTPALTITKTADSSSVVTGGTVGYTILVANTGQTTYAAASFKDDLATVLTDATYSGDAAATTGGVTYSGSVLSWTGSLAPGATASVSYSVVVRDPDPGDKRMTNTVVSTAARNNCATGSTDSRCTAVVNVLVPGLTITKTADAATAVPGATIGYTVAVTNSGTTAYTGATFSDSLGAVLDDATYSGGATATTGTVSLSGQTLLWTGDLAVGASATITYSVTVRATSAGDNLLTNTAVSGSRGSNCAASSADARCTVVVPVARLDLHQYAAEATITPGSIVHVTAVYTNTGQVPYTGISVSSPRADTSDDTVPTGDQSASSGVLTRTDTALIWTGSIPVGGTVTIVRTLTVKNPDPGNQIIRATVSSDAPGNNCPTGATDPRCTFSVAVLTPALSISKSASTTTAAPGATVGFTITVTNTGQTAYAGAVVTDSLTGALDDATFTGNAVASTGTLDYSSPTLTWTGDLGVGATAVVTYSMVAKSPATGDKTMVNQVSSTNVGSTCPPASAVAGCRVTVLVLTPALTLVKTADVNNATLGTAVTYTVLVTNSGQTPYSTATMTDSLSGVLDDATYQAGSAAATRGAVSYSAGVISWSGALNPGASATITYRVTISNPATGDLSLINSAVSSNAGSNCTSGSTDTRCTAVVAITNTVTLTLSSTADVSSAVAGQQVHHTLTVRNSSAQPVFAASFSDDLTGLLDDASFNSDVVASDGSASFAGSAVSWAGDVAAGATITVTFSVTVHATALPSGDQILTDRVSSTSVPDSNNCLTGSTDPRCVSTVTIASLLLQQSYTESTTTPGSVLHLTATFTNTGTTPYNGITVSSPSADTVDDAIVTGDQSATSGTLVLNASAITWTGNIPVGGTVTVTGTLTAKSPDLSGNRRITGTLVSAAPGSNCPAGGSDSRCTALSLVLLPGLTLTKTADATFTTPGGTVGYTITVRNSGETAYTAATVTDSLTGVLDDASYNAPAVASSGSLSYTAPTLTWTGALAVNATVTITYSVTAAAPGTGDKSMVNTVSSDAVGSTCSPAASGSACTSSVDIRTPALTTLASASRTSAVPGDVVSYTVTTTNTGQTDYSAATFSIPLAGLLDDATYQGNAAASTGAVVRTGTSLDWTGALPTGAQVVLTFSVTVQTPVTGDHRLESTVTSTSQGSNCVGGGTDPRCTTSVPVASLQILNVANVSTAKPTDEVRYTGTFTNTGQVPYVGITVYDSFVGALDNATYNGDATASSGSVIIVVGSGRIVWTGDVGVGQIVTITGSVTVNNPPTGDGTLTTLIRTDAAATNCPTGGTDAACATSVTLLRPALSISKVASKTTTTPGSTVGYTITATNTGQTTYTGAEIRDDLRAALTDASVSTAATATSGTVASSNQVLTWTGDLAVNQTVVISYSLRIDDPDLGDKALVNAVTSDELGSSCPTGGSAAACTTLVTVLVPALTIAVAADSTTTTPGSPVGYTITVKNAGELDYAGATVTANLEGVLDDATYGGDAVSTVPGQFVFAEGTLSWTGALAIGQTAVITYSAVVAKPDVGNRDLATSVSSPAAGSTCTAGSPCTNHVAVLLPGLAVSTTADSPTATPGDPVTFTIRIHNTGETAYVNTSVSTDLARVLDDATFGGTITSSSGTASYVAPQLTWTGSLALDQTVVLSYTVVVKPVATLGDKVLRTTVVADAAGSTCPTGAVNGGCTAEVDVLVPALTISKSADTATTTPGGQVLYTIHVANTGQTTYTGATVSDSLSELLDEATYGADAAVTGGGVLSYVGSTLTWTGDLLPGATATIHYSIRVNKPYVGDRSLSNSVVSSAAGSTCPTGDSQAGCTSVVRVLIPALGVTQTVDKTSVVAGDAVRYTVTLTNTGETDYLPATFRDAFADPGILRFADYANDASATVGTVSYTNQTLVWTGPLLIGQTVTVTFSVVTRYPAPAPVNGVRVMRNTVTSATAGSTCVTGTRARCQTAVTVLSPALTLTKTADTSQVVAGGTLRYTIAATNDGEADYATASLSDDLSGLLPHSTYRSDATATAGTVGYSNGTVTWSGPVARGATVLISFSIGVAVDTPDSTVLTNRVVSSTVGSNCAAGSDAAGCVSSTSIAARTISLSSLTPSFTLSGAPSSTVIQNDAVSMTVTTNSVSGYAVSLRATGNALTGRSGNADTIPISQLSVRNSGAPTFVPVSDTEPLTIYRKDSASAAGGDAVTNDYQVDIPDVASDTYSTTVEYIATAQ